MHREWFEPALARHLDRVAAPEDLWERVRNPERGKKNGVHRSVNAARLGACATILLLVGWLFVGGRIRPRVLRVTGASVEIAYRDGRLMVAKGRHSMPSGARVFTWSKDGHIYTLSCATPEDLRIACGLCHVG